MAQTQTKKKTSSAAKGRAKTGAAQKKSGRRAPQPPEKCVIVKQKVDLLRRVKWEKDISQT